MIERENVAGVLLAGGQARRMGGGDKCLRQIGGRSILAHIIERLSPQVSGMMLNANGDPARFDAFGLPVRADSIDGFAGPLAGVLTGMDWVIETGRKVDWILTAPTDAPFLPTDLCDRLRAAINTDGSDMARAESGGRAHPVVGLWPVALRDDLHDAMRKEDIRKVDRWTARYAVSDVEFASVPIDPFFNANTPEDIATAESFLNDVAG
jgi:molybdopterin-guanine dinucleotide biosynthesis protein A